jgi:hypothetical protein
VTESATENKPLLLLTTAILSSLDRQHAIKILVLYVNTLVKLGFQLVQDERARHDNKYTLSLLIAVFNNKSKGEKVV